MAEINRRCETSISKARAYVEIGEFWNEHDLSDYWGKTKKVKIDVLLEPEVTYYPLSEISPKSSTPL
jgi:hypothetical protein